eukprot:SAG31_NODE_1344_length_8699_cov_15.971512_2_plen_86_part_00
MSDSAEEVADIWEEMLSKDRDTEDGGDRDGKISLQEFLAWYNSSTFFTAWVQLQEETPDEVPLDLRFPSNGAYRWPASVSPTAGP